MSFLFYPSRNMYGYDDDDFFGGSPFYGGYQRTPRPSYQQQQLQRQRALEQERLRQLEQERERQRQYELYKQALRQQQQAEEERRARLQWEEAQRQKQARLRYQQEQQERLRQQQQLLEQQRRASRYSQQEDNEDYDNEYDYQSMPFTFQDLFSPRRVQQQHHNRRAPRQPVRRVVPESNQAVQPKHKKQQQQQQVAPAIQQQPEAQPQNEVEQVVDNSVKINITSPRRNSKSDVVVEAPPVELPPQAEEPLVKQEAESMQVEEEELQQVNIEEDSGLVPEKVVEEQEQVPEQPVVPMDEESTKSLSQIEVIAQRVQNIENKLKSEERPSEKNLITYEELLIQEMLRLDGIFGNDQVRSRRRMEIVKIQSLLELVDEFKSASRQQQQQAM